MKLQARTGSLRAVTSSKASVLDGIRDADKTKMIKTIAGTAHKADLDEYDSSSGPSLAAKNTSPNTATETTAVIHVSL